ncbi:MAG TPA: malonyl-CoA synthase [Rhizomicrobium sp.]|nr:malonyl-CoA synthase [Rhizomicrobium sp.]
MADNLFQRFLRATDPDRVFVIPPGRPAITYREAFSVAAQLAHVLAAHGVVPGDRVAVQVEKSPEALFLYLACLRVGAVYLPLNTGYTPTELAYFVGDAEPRLLVCSEKNKAKIAATLPATELLTLSDDGASGSLIVEATAAPADFRDAAVSMNDLASILYTSGTTGRSKGAMLTHGNLCSNAETLKQAWSYTDRDVLLHALPIFHIHGLFVASNITLISGAAMILLPKFDLDAIFQAMPDASVMMGVPTFYTRMLQDSRLNLDTTRHMRLFVSGSAPLLAETHRQWRERTGHEILERYGMTETNMNTSNPYAGARVPGSVGLPLPGVELRIADKDGAPLPQGEIGMIEVRGPNVFKGYWRMPDKTAAEFRPDGFFMTGDLGTIDANGYVQIVGRDKDLIISGGFNVYPKEIESLIDDLPGVEESAVVGLPHHDFGEAVTAFIIAKPDAKLSEKSVLAAFADTLARFKHPKRVIFLDQLPRNTMGKVQKSLMRESYKDLYAR